MVSELRSVVDLWGFRSPPELVTCGDRQPGMIADVSLLHGGAASASSLAAEDQVRPERLGILQHRLSRAWARPGRHRIGSRHPRPPRDPRRHGHDLPVRSGAASGDRAWICRAGGLAVVDGTGPDGGQATRRPGRSGDRPARPGRGSVNRQRPITYPPRALSRACRFQPTNGAGNLTVKLRPYRSALVDTRHRRASYCRPGHRVRSAPRAGSPQQSALSGDPPGHRQGSAWMANRLAGLRPLILETSLSGRSLRVGRSSSRSVKAPPGPCPRDLLRELDDKSVGVGDMHCAMSPRSIHRTSQQRDAALAQPGSDQIDVRDEENDLCSRARSNRTTGQPLRPSLLVEGEAGRA